jgi:hypothetical protein
MVVGFTTTCAISAYHQLSCEFESRSWRGILSTTLCDKVCQLLAAGLWFSPGPPVSSTNKTDSYDITEILSKAALNTMTSHYTWINTLSKYFI